MSSNDFRKELDKKAISRGCTRLPGASFGSELGTSQGYSFINGRILNFIANDKYIEVHLQPQPPKARSDAMTQQAINSNIPSTIYNECITQVLLFNWENSSRLWVLQSPQSQSNYEGLYDIDGKSLGQHLVIKPSSKEGKRVVVSLSSENIAQSLVNWLCEQ